MSFKVYQIENTPENHELIKEATLYEESGNIFNEHKAMKAFKENKYTLVAEVNTDDAEEVFYIMNSGDLSNKITEFKVPYHPLSVGDILVDSEDNILICATFGFDNLTELCSLCVID